jgi:hypothetical protein
METTNLGHDSHPYSINISSAESSGSVAREVRGGLISLWLYKKTSYGIEKMYLHIPP